MTHRFRLAFFVAGVPKPQGSKRYIGNNRFVEASDVKPWRRAIGKAADAALLASDLTPIDEPVVVLAVFCMPKPKTVNRLWPSVAPDLDKLQRALGDGMTVDGSVLVDDSRIVAWQSFKVYADVPGVYVVIEPADDALSNRYKDLLGNVFDIQE
jgi:Holliday junction resolvase RusA-like endonuclease